jgi:hypothetical protein
VVAAWITVPCLLVLRDEINALAPARAKGADGTIGDTAHASGGTSDHLPDDDPLFPALHGKDADKLNEVHALDITTELNQPGLALEAIVQFILARCRTGAEKRLRYIIFNRRIWEAANAWRQRAYTLADPHTGHAHFSASYDTIREADRSPWHLEDIPVALTAADKAWQEAMTVRVVDARVKVLEANILAKLAGVPAAVWDGPKLNVHVGSGEAPSMQKPGDILRYLSPEGKEARDLTIAVGKDVADLVEQIAAQPAAGA